MLRRHLPAKVRVALLTLSALSVLFASGCGDDTPAKPRVVLRASLDTSPEPGAGDCGDTTGSWFALGSFTDPIYAVDDGADDRGGTASVNCAVIPTTDGFIVRAAASLNGDQGGAFRVDGTFLNGQDSSNIDISVAHRGSTYTQTDCTATFDGVPSVTGGPVAAGRVWAIVTCPKAVDADHQRTCQAVTQMRFENCTQQ